MQTRPNPPSSRSPFAYSPYHPLAARTMSFRGSLSYAAAARHRAPPKFVDDEDVSRSSRDGARALTPLFLCIDLKRRLGVAAERELGLRPGFKRAAARCRAGGVGRSEWEICNEEV